MDLEKMRTVLLDIGVCEQTLIYISYINGYSKETFLDVLYVHTGYRTFEQLFEEWSQLGK